MLGRMMLSVGLALVALGSAQQQKANIIMLLTDDQDLRLGSMVAMPAAREVLLAGGANLSNFFIATPICCPSRAALLSGRYEHNNKVSGPGVPGCMRQNTSKTDNPKWWSNGFVPQLAKAGYTVGMFGKVLNTMTTYGCDGSGLPEGVDRLNIMCAIDYYNAQWADFGPGSNNSVYKTGSAPEDYTTSIVGNSSLAWIKSVIADKDHKPFFAYMGPHAPHLPSTPAVWYQDHPIGNTPVPKEVYYNYAPVKKHAFGAPYVTLDQLLPEVDDAAIATEHSNRLKTLLSVDDIVRDVSSTLMAAGEWDNTYFFYSSDHGYSLGEFRVDSHKTQVWDHNTRVPAMFKGPGIAAGSVMPAIASMVDMGPTFIELATGAPPPEWMDGMSFASILTGKNPTAQGWKDAQLIEYQSIRPTVQVSEAERASAEYRSAYGYRTEDDGVPPPLKIHAHDGPNNTFSAIRIINETAGINLLYAEFADVLNPRAWNFAPDQINFYELYDVAAGDFYMLNNIYDSASPDMKQRLHNRLQTAIKCSGRLECFAALHGGV